MSAPTDSQPENPKWYSIKEAAEYLSVGEPTLYRWMREGRITYRKVGDSTRFWREDLDSMMEVFPSAKNLDAVRNFCPVCHHGDMVEGRMEAGETARFRPMDEAFPSARDGGVETSAWMCLQCGAIAWFGNLERLHRGRGGGAART